MGETASIRGAAVSRSSLDLPGIQDKLGQTLGIAESTLDQWDWRDPVITQMASAPFLFAISREEERALKQDQA